MYATYQFGANWKNWKCNPCCFLKHIEWYRRNISIDTAPLRRINLQFTDGEIQAEVTNDSDRCCGQEKNSPLKVGQILIANLSTVVQLQLLSSLTGDVVIYLSHIFLQINTKSRRTANKSCDWLHKSHNTFDTFGMPSPLPLHHQSHNFHVN